MGGMEAAICNLVEPGDELVVCVNGFFGARMSEIAQRSGARVTEVRESWGRPVSFEAVRNAISNCARPVAVALVHAETSTGVLQPLSEIARLAHERGAVLIADTVTSLGGVELDIDRMGIDVAYSGSQKCLNCPPGLSPITATERAIQIVKNRKTKVRSWYFDLTEIEKYWSKTHAYHHTGPISMIYALREALRIVHEEGLENRWTRHQRNCEALAGGLEAMGLTPLVDRSGDRLPSLTAVKVPDGISDTKLRMTLLSEYNIEVGGGLGELKGQILRIGLMGLNSSRNNVILLLDALENALRKEGYSIKKGAGLEAALAYYQS